MPNIKKPAFTAPQTADLKKGLDRLEEYVNDVKKADGTVDMDELADKVGRSRTDHVKEGFEVLKDEYTRTTTRRVTDSCGGTRTRTSTSPAEELSSAEVSSVMDALIAAKSKVDAMDVNADGKIDRAEADDAPRRGLANKLASTGAKMSLEDYEVELESWRDAITLVRETVDQRVEFSGTIDSAADFHAESADGKEALRWGYRALIINSAYGDFDVEDAIYKIDDFLDEAESGFLRSLPTTSSVQTGRGHLSDTELKGFFVTDDLGAFAAQKKAEVLAKVGNFDEWLEGKDLPGHDQVDDPDADGGNAWNAYTSSSSSGC